MPDQVEPQGAASKRTPAKKAAPAKKAPAKKAPAKKAPAKKAPTKQAAAKKAAAKAVAQTPRATIFNRIQELESRISAEPPRTARPEEHEVADAPPKPVVRKRPAPRPAPVVSRTVVPRAARVPRTAPVPESAAAVVPEVVGATAGSESLVAATDAPAAPAVFDHATEPDRPVTLEEPAPRRAAPAPAQPGSGRWLVVTVIVLLLALAAGLAAAAAARNRPATWSSHAVVSLTPASSSAADTVVPAGQKRYEERVDSTSFTALAAFQAGVKQQDLRSLLSAEPGDDGTVVVTAKASTSGQAAKLAAAAGNTLVLAVTSDETQLVGIPGDRLTPAITTAASDPVRVEPSSSDIWWAGLLAGLATLLVGAMVALLVGSRRR